MKTLRFNEGDHAVYIGAEGSTGTEVVIIARGPFHKGEWVRISPTARARCTNKDPDYFAVAVTRNKCQGFCFDRDLMPLKGDDEQFRREREAELPRIKTINHPCAQTVMVSTITIPWNGRY